jgi:hypothetical protein
MFSLFGLRREYLLPPVESALWADSVEEYRVSAVAAADERRSSKLHVYGAASARSRLGSPKFRYSHDITSFPQVLASTTGDVIQKCKFCQERSSAKTHTTLPHIQLL